MNFHGFDNLRMSVRVNGETWGEGDTSEMLWTPEELIAYVSLGDHAQPGDVIGSGTMGNGSALELGRSVKPGDVIALDVSGVGVLRNRIAQRAQRQPGGPSGGRRSCKPLIAQKRLRGIGITIGRT
ncbi:hypothetical protein BZM27_54625 [Paraburkholderia steynii]|uniref:Fumarylacetoacetase-like C-terminal domain-containing protein n=1 Tax=Paraburkholderia steynii TaxID=1245441 RepID=A0A4R0WTC7_9BURK|nr:hypothetical protein BZM27_54625 [Paraburkholderia steynii]